MSPYFLFIPIGNQSMREDFTIPTQTTSSQIGMRECHESIQVTMLKFSLMLQWYMHRFLTICRAHFPCTLHTLSLTTITAVGYRHGNLRTLQKYYMVSCCFLGLHTGLLHAYVCTSSLQMKYIAKKELPLLSSKKTWLCAPDIKSLVSNKVMGTYL